MQAAQNDLLTRIGPGTPCGDLMRRYWQPVALLDEFEPRFDPRMAERPLKAVRLLGQDLVLFRDSAGQWGLLDRDCPHRGADLAFARHEGEGIRCPFHGWKFAADGRCLETPAEPMGSTLCQRVRQRSYPVRVQANVIFAYLGPEDIAPPELPAFDAFVAPASHTFAFKGLWRCNWLQAFEVGIDPAHPSFLHRYLEDEQGGDPEKSYGRQFRAATVGEVDGERWPMTRIMREFCSPEIHHEEVAPGLTKLTTLRLMNDKLTHVRVTHAAFPHTFVIPLSETLTITQMHVPVDDENTYWYSFFTSFGAPLDRETMRTQRLAHITLPDYVPKNGRHNNWHFDPDEQRNRTYLGMGEEDINLHDQWAVESMGRIQDRTREHLGSSDKVIMANRRLLLKAIDTVKNGGTPPMVLNAADAAALHGPDTMDCVAPADGWQAFWQNAAAAKRAGAPWLAQTEAATTPMTLAQRCGAASPAREATCAALLRRLQDEGIEQVRVAWADLHGSYRGKTLIGREAVAAALQDGIGLVSTVLLKDTSDRTAFKVFEPDALAARPALQGFGSANNLLLLPDPSTLQILPWAGTHGGTAWLRAEPWFEDGSPVPVCPRRVLQGALAQLADAGYGLRCGLEIEFHIYRITDAKLAVDDAAWPAEPPALQLIHPGYKLLAEELADLADEPLAIVRHTALALGLPLRSLEIELGPSQVEAVFAATDALTAADQMLQFRNHVRQALRRAGYHASFVCRPPLPNAIASGWHLHQSLVADGRNAMVRHEPQGDARDARQLLSDAGTHWLAGLLAHAPALAAISAPTLPAYSRFRNSVMAPQAAVWGRDNRGAMLRVVGGPGDPATRVENRIGEPLANPYLTIAAQIFAGLDGLQRRLDPGPETESPYAAHAAPLPASLAAAIDALAADTALQRGLGPAMAQVYDTVKRQELARHAQAEDQLLWERREYFGRY